MNSKKLDMSVPVIKDQSEYNRHKWDGSPIQVGDDGTMYQKDINGVIYDVTQIVGKHEKR